MGRLISAGRPGHSLLLRTALAAAVLLWAFPAPAGPDTVSEQVLSAGLSRAESGDLEAWHEGPVRYLLEGPETRLYRSLTTDRERRAFIKQFWLRRDPNRGSLENEFRFQFWQRVVDANQLFTRTTEPGWKTDRGKFYIILGPPDELEKNIMPKRRGGVAIPVPNLEGPPTARMVGGDKPSESFLGRERWVYHSRPGPHTRTNFVLAFRLNHTGDYEVSTDPGDSSLFADMLSERVGALTEFENVGFTDRPVDDDLMSLYNDIALVLDLGAVQRVPNPEELLGELVTSEEFFGTFPFLLQTDFYKTDGPATLAVFTVGIEGESLGRSGSRKPVPDLLAVGKLQSLEDPARQILLTGDESLVPAPDNETAPSLLLYQVVKALPPGEYNASFGILDRQRNRIGSYKERIRVPSFPSAGLSLSTLSLARRLLPLELEPADTGTAAAPFRLGNYEVVPRTEPRFANGEEFVIYYQVYGAAPDPSRGHPVLDLTYRFSVLEEGEFVPIGKPIRYPERTQAVQGWSFPLMNWPRATFRLEVMVEDQVSGHTAMGQTIFGIQGSEEPG